jgi:hypothetical protein
MADDRARRKVDAATTGRQTTSRLSSASSNHATRRTVNPLIVPTRYNFLYSSSRQQAGVASYSETEPRACEARGSEL